MKEQPQTRLLLTGASGLVGSALTPRLEEQDLSWTALHHGQPGWAPEEGVLDPKHLDGVTGVVHLAGEPIAAGRWTEETKRKIRDSRVNGTRALAEALARREPKPSVMVCASAIGWYGDRGDEELTESSPPGEGFLPQVVRDWEAAADPAREAGIRVVHLRLGIVLSPQGGALKKMLPPFKLGLGGPLGDGRMWMSWVHLEDAARAFHQAVTDPSMRGAFNLVAPHPVRNREFTQTLGRALHRPTVLPVPRLGIKLLLGEMGETLLLASTRVAPERLREADFTFQHPDLPAALERMFPA